MSLEDRLAIHDVIARYSYTYDARDADAFALLFVEDAVFEVVVPAEPTPRVRLTSRAAIHRWATGRHALHAAAQARHHQSAIVFDELAAAAARTRTMLLLTRQGAPDAMPVVVLTGVYEDRWRKTPDGWRFAHRVARVDRDPGFPREWA